MQDVYAVASTIAAVATMSSMLAPRERLLKPGLALGVVIFGPLLLLGRDETNGPFLRFRWRHERAQRLDHFLELRARGGGETARGEVGPRQVFAAAKGELPILSFPGINYRHVQILKMPRVAGGKRGAPRQRNTRDLRVAHVHWSPGFLPLGGQ